MFEVSYGQHSAKSISTICIKFGISADHSVSTKESARFDIDTCAGSSRPAAGDMMFERERRSSQQQSLATNSANSDQKDKSDIHIRHLIIINFYQIICLSISGSKSQILNKTPQVEYSISGFYLKETFVNLYFVIFSDLSHTYFCTLIIYYFTHSYFFSKMGGNLVYDIYGTRYLIHALKVIQSYVRLVNSSINLFFVITLFRAA